jgi:inorganic phosphate transporter, PiT family
MNVIEYVLVAAAFAFAFSIGAHYTGACMGMPYAAGAVRLVPALLLMAPLTLLGAAVASGAVEQTVGHGILGSAPVSIALALAIILSALTLTSLYNLVRIPTSTIQILVFSTVGAGLGAGLAIEWRTIEILLVLWAIAPFVAFGLGYAFVRAADRRSAPPTAPSPLARTAVFGLVTVGLVASFAMGANDVSNASGAFVMTGIFGIMTAGIVGGIGLTAGVLTWGRPLLQRVAFDIVKLDARMAISAQLAQAVVILGYVVFGYFTSMNQALVGAMIGAGVARRRSTVVWKTVRELLAGWAIGPASGAALGFALATAFGAAHLL